MRHDLLLDHSAGEEVTRICDLYAPRLPEGERSGLVAAVRAEFDRRSGVAVSDYVHIFVERSVRSRYGLLRSA
jgi:hypothetical protein